MESTLSVLTGEAPRGYELLAARKLRGATVLHDLIKFEKTATTNFRKRRISETEGRGAVGAPVIAFHTLTESIFLQVNFS
jgi:hypothetical protein